jgi:translation elongation factor EF-1beta
LAIYLAQKNVHKEMNEEQIGFGMSRLQMGYFDV